jgi:predicted RNA-binding Zn-ribbon protein involved in translation (DUF1610 family)
MQSDGKRETEFTRHAGVNRRPRHQQPLAGTPTRAPIYICPKCGKKLNTGADLARPGRVVFTCRPKCGFRRVRYVDVAAEHTQTQRTGVTRKVLD